MKRRGLFIQSAALVFSALVMLTVAAFAWFSASDGPGLGSFSVQVKGSASVQTRFYVGAEAGGTVSYTEVSPSETSPFISGETLYPGISVYRRVEVKNLSDFSAALTVDFTGVSVTYVAAGADRAAEIAALDAAVTVRVSAYRGGAQGAEAPVRFIAAADGGADELRIAAFPLSAGETVVVDYRFTVDKDFTSDAAGGALSLAATGIRFVCD